MKGLVFQSYGGFVDYYELSKRFNNDKLQYVVGFVINYQNGYFTVSGGGGCSGMDISNLWLIDSSGNILYEDSYKI